MSAQKKKTPIIAIVAVVLLLAAGAVAYFAQKSPKTEGTDQVAAVGAEQGQQAEGDSPEDVATAAGDAAQKAEDVPDINTEGIQVEAGNPVVAKVDGKEINRNDVYRFISTMPQNYQQSPAVVVYPMAMQQVIDTQIVQSKAEEANITESEQYKKEMEIVGQQIARAIYLQKQVDKKITEKMLKDAYEEYLKSVPDVEERRARHILTETEDKAKAVVERLKKGGDFAEVAKELSTGPSAPKGGDLGYFAKTEMVPEFANAAFGMDKNSILQTPVKTQFGWHVIQLVDIRQRPKPTMEQMEPVLKAELSRNALEDLVTTWREQADIEQFDINGKPLKEGANVIGIVPPEPKEKDKQDG